MEGNPIIIGEFSIPERIMVGVRTPIEREVKGNHTPPTKGQVDLTPSDMIVGFAACFKLKRVSSFVKTSSSTLTLKAPMVVFPLPQLPALSVKAIIARSSN